MSQLMIRCFQRNFAMICLALGLALTFAEFSNVSGNEEDLRNRTLVRLTDLERFQNEKGNARLSGMNIWWVDSSSLFDNYGDPSLQPLPGISSKRANSALVGSIMALLATFEAANVLPPEGTSPTNQLIHGLIQLQSVLVKSQDSELHEYVARAVDHSFKEESASLIQAIHRSGLTSKILEALVIYDQQLPMWDQPAIPQIFHRYNVSRSDWLLIEQIFANANLNYRTNGSSIHEVYEQRRSQLAEGR